MLAFLAIFLLPAAPSTALGATIGISLLRLGGMIYAYQAGHRKVDVGDVHGVAQ